MEGNLEGMQFSLERVGSAASFVNAGTEDGRTPLHVAAWWCDSPAPLELLIRSGANLRKKDRFGQNTLHWAARGGNYDIVKFVLDHQAGNYAEGVGGVGQTSAGVDPMELDATGKTALDLAESATTVPAPRVVTLLRERMRLSTIGGETAAGGGGAAGGVCGSCEENPVDVVFKPCGCKIACEECAKRWKKCVGCKTPIREKEKLSLSSPQRLLISGDDEGAAGPVGGHFRGRPSTASLNGESEVKAHFAMSSDSVLIVLS